LEYSRVTPTSDAGDGSIFYLDKHDIWCNSGGVLRSFNLMRVSGNSICFKFRCVQNESIISMGTIIAYTNWSVISNDLKKSAWYLDRHDIKCSEDYGLSRFILERSGNDIRFSYHCTPIKFTVCGSSQTIMQGGYNGEIFYLDRHNIDTYADDAVLTGFRVKVDWLEKRWINPDSIRFQFIYTYCYLRNVSAEQVAAQAAINTSKSMN
jgi:hypothetical protein